MNLGGFSWRRLIGISAFKSRVSRKIGIPLTVSGRRRKLGASVFNAVGSVAGTLAVAAAAKREESNRKPTKSASLKGVYFCEVKGVTHNNDDSTSRIAAQQLCSVGDTVKLVPEPSNVHDRNAIRVLLQTGQQIGYISARQAARFKGKVHLLTATVHSRVKDKWGNETVKLRVSAEQKVYQTSTAPSVTAIQAEATKTVEKEGWQATLVYFENTAQGLYKVVKAEDAEAISQSLQEGMIQVGFIGLSDTPTGIQFTFTLNDGLPTNGIIAKRFLVNAREWVVTQSKDICARRGDPPPIVGKFQASKKPSHIKLVLILLAVIVVIILIIATISKDKSDTSSVPTATPEIRAQCLSLPLPRASLARSHSRSPHRRSSMYSHTLPLVVNTRGPAFIQLSYAYYLARTRMFTGYFKSCPRAAYAMVAPLILSPVLIDGIVCGACVLCPYSIS